MAEPVETYRSPRHRARLGHRFRLRVRVRLRLRIRLSVMLRVGLELRFSNGRRVRGSSW